jgi:uncharacterized protein YqgV (UPF0045/DUF77 family)
MFISAQVSLYPLRQDHLSPAIGVLNETLRAAGLRPEVGTMSTVITGEADAAFEALRRGFLAASATGHVVMVVTLSNACPA